MSVKITKLEHGQDWNRDLWKTSPMHCQLSYHFATFSICEHKRTDWQEIAHHMTAFKLDCRVFVNVRTMPENIFRESFILSENNLVLWIGRASRTVRSEEWRWSPERRSRSRSGPFITIPNSGPNHLNSRPKGMSGKQSGNCDLSERIWVKWQQLPLSLLQAKVLIFLNSCCCVCAY